MKVIVTGFNPFGTLTANPSQEAVLGLPDIVKINDKTRDALVVKLILPTCCTESFQILRDVVQANSAAPFALILSGLAERREKISLERFALNIRDFRIADNNGHKWDEEYIYPQGPDAIRSKVPLRQLCRHLNNVGLASEISSHAGTFVCNECYYRSLFSFQQLPECRGVVFVHFPDHDSYKPLAQGGFRQPGEAFTTALAEIALFLAERADGQTSEHTVFS